MSEGVDRFHQAVSEIEGIDRLKLIFEHRDPFLLDELEHIDPFQYDTVILLSRGDHLESEEQMDADTLLLVLLLRRLRDKQIGRPRHTRTDRSHSRRTRRPRLHACQCDCSSLPYSRTPSRSHAS